MVNCGVINCKNYAGNKHFAKKVKYFSFPKDLKLLRGWVKACEESENLNPKTERIYSQHFDESYYKFQDVLLGEPILKKPLKNSTVSSRNIPATRNNVTEIKEEAMKFYGLSKDE